MTAADATHIVIALFSGGGVWLLGREIAKQWGETRRERIRQDAETQRLTIVHVLPLPGAVSQPSTSEDQPRAA
ncbi:hypothetical protein [Dactylosporangium sp. NPDC005555]|uniref:hypothetical protein n=1 Tax=Dactylosporangium sp. NPDC005555 TaxID=3154889 RepID=UPI0033B56C79